jgi:general secretion pathway protein I
MVRMHSNSTKGFTLVEVMVALVIVAVALPALLISVYRQVDGTAYLRDKSVANWVAANKMAEIRLISSLNSRMLEGKNSGSEEMADREWYWWVEGEKTTVENFYRMTVSVGPDADEQSKTLIRLVGFVEKNSG